MRSIHLIRRLLIGPAAAALVVAGAVASAQGPGQGPVGPIASVPNGFQNTGAQPATATEHPLAGAMRMALSTRETIKNNIKDYTCTMIKRERVDGKLSDPNYMFVKIRHEPFSVYLYFLKPDDVAGRECLYVEGANGGKLLAHEAKGLKSRFGTVALEPTSAMAMEGNRYPITQIGISNLTRRLIEVAQHDIQFGECTVDYRKNAKINDRICTIIEVNHPVPRRDFLFNKARIYLDDELNVPIRYEAYIWPKTPGGQPLLDEEYTYLNFKPNVGLTNADFDPHNPSYHFYK